MMTTVMNKDEVKNLYMTIRGPIDISRDDTSLDGIWIRFGEDWAHAVVVSPQKLRVEVWDV